MVNISIDVTDLGGEARPGDKVVFWRPRMGGSATHAGRVISTAPVTVFLTDGKATVSDVEPGEMTVLLQCRGVESQGPVTVGVPDGNGTVTLRALLESQFEYAPPIVSAVQEAASNASASEEAAIQAQVRSEAAADRADAKVDEAINNGAELVRDEVKQDADRAVSARQAATQSESKAKASEGAAASSASNAATSETNAKQSETNAGDYAAVATTAATEAVDAMDSVADIIGAKYATQEYVDDGLSVKADKAYVDEKLWFRGNLGKDYNLDDYTGSVKQGTYTLSSSAGGHPLGTPGWLKVSHDSYSGRTRQEVTASSPTDGREVYRTYSGGVWSAWRPNFPVGNTLTSTYGADSLVYPGYYAVGNPAAPDLPERVLGSVLVLPAGTSVSQNVHFFVSSEPTPRMWVRRAGGAWTRIGEETKPEEVPEPTPARITWDPGEESTRVASEIAGALSHDRMTIYNGVGGPLRQSRDQGKTWEIVTTFSGQSIELVEPLENGEILVATSGTVDGVSSTRRVYISDGYDPANPSGTQWGHKLTGSAQFVKFVDWSVSQHGPIVLLAEYGPKGGMVWGSGTEPIPEGSNARYVHLSLDYGKTWSQVFDLNTFMESRGQTTVLRHIHGIAWDPYWDRIWLSFGDSMGGNGSNGVIYSDNLGATWEVAYHSAEVDTPEGWQVVGIQPMKDCVLFAGDMTPAGVMRLDREGGKYREKWEFIEAWNYGASHKLLCHAVRHYATGRGEVALFGFSREGTASPSIIVGTRDGVHWDLLWESADAANPGFRFMAGPTLTGELIAAVNRGGSWVEIRGYIDAY